MAGAAYRAGESLTERPHNGNETERVHRYTKRGSTVREALILLPDEAPAWAADRGELWNRVEEFETRKNARVGREVQLGLAYELRPAEQKALVLEFARREFVDQGFAVDIAFHDYGKRIPAAGAGEADQARLREWAKAGMPFIEPSEATGRDDEHVLVLRDRANQVTGYKHYQPHAHLRVTPRPFAGDEFSKSKETSRVFDKHETAMRWRYEWPKLQNAYLERAGSEVRVRAVGDDEEQFPGLPRLAEGGSQEIHAIAERAHELDDQARQKHEEARATEDRDRAFRAVHNDTIRLSFIDDNTEASDEERDERRQMRLGAWWRNIGERLKHWPFEVKDHADLWRDRLALQANRLLGLLGWHFKPDDVGSGDKPPGPVDRSQGKEQGDGPSRDDHGGFEL
ncbi:MobA/MobL family protein [Jiella pacifica]|uniref:MobA/MobL family protein n=1 Tax=Jiella pacifica TaxID=2696469 RepID=A0A6N9T8R2_9HYPH|nr:MobA/MobL family protein [Jiella pacifica]NDW07827.1 MobA/MobL family protein [Jiella pacifica]